MKIIFACVHNAGRSQMAAAFLNALANHNMVEAVSAGTQPGKHLHPEVVTVMKEMGIDLSHAKPQLLTEEIAIQADLLITMGCGDGCPYVPELKREDWPLTDPKGKTLDEVRKIRDEIKGKVEQLIGTFKQGVSIKAMTGIELVSTDQESISKVLVTAPAVRTALSWDRFIRLNAAAKALKEIASKDSKILDVGGYDGALALFLSDYQIDLIDPATTGASFLDSSLCESSYDIVVAVDVLEHIGPTVREQFLSKLSKVARFSIILNYPHPKTKIAQELVLNATNNALICEHVQWQLPDAEWVLSKMRKFGFNGQAISYGNLAVWLGQYLTLNLAPQAAHDLNRYLVDNHSDEPFSIPLYELVVCNRESAN